MVGVNNDVVMIDDGLLFRILFVSFESRKKSCVSVSSCSVVEMACCVVSGLLEGRLYSRCPIVVCSLSSSGRRVDFSACGLCRTTLLSTEQDKDIFSNDSLINFEFTNKTYLRSDYLVFDFLDYNWVVLVEALKRWWSIQISIQMVLKYVYDF